MDRGGCSLPFLVVFPPSESTGVSPTMPFLVVFPPCKSTGDTAFCFCFHLLQARALPFLVFPPSNARAFSLQLWGLARIGLPAAAAAAAAMRRRRPSQRELFWFEFRDHSAKRPAIRYVSCQILFSHSGLIAALRIVVFRPPQPTAAPSARTTGTF